MFGYAELFDITQQPFFVWWRSCWTLGFRRNDTKVFAGFDENESDFTNINAIFLNHRLSNCGAIQKLIHLTQKVPNQLRNPICKNFRLNSCQAHRDLERKTRLEITIYA